MDTKHNTSPPSYDESRMTEQSDSEKFKNIMDKYDIQIEYAKKIRQLDGFEIVIIADDSGSMNNPVTIDGDPYVERITRWDELKKRVGIIAEIAVLMDPTGIDVYFLNRDSLFGVKNIRELDKSFGILPDGPTPICKVLRKVLYDKKEVVAERKLLIMIATDGVPTNDKGESDIETLKNILEHERNPVDKIFVTFMACTEDDKAVAYLNDFDKKIKNVDTVDDYASELKEVIKAKGKMYPFSFGDHIVKSLIGSVDTSFDDLDEKKGCCVIL